MKKNNKIQAHPHSFCGSLKQRVGKQQGYQKRQAADFIWSKNGIVEEPVNRVLYYLQGEPDTAFASEELHISEDTQVLPEWVSKWK